MRLRHFLFVPLFLVLTSIFSYRVTYSYFKNSASAHGNTFSAASSFAIVPNLKINEFIPNPGIIFSTEWVEIFNTGSVAVDLTGWSLSDDANHVKSLSSLGIINPGEFKVYENSEGWLNNTGGDSVILRDQNGSVVDSYSYSGTMNDDVSVGRTIDGDGVFKMCTTPTKGASNNSHC